MQTIQERAHDGQEGRGLPSPVPYGWRIVLINIDNVKRRQLEIKTEVAALRVSEAPDQRTRLEELKALADFLRTLSLVHARLDRGEPKNLAEIAEYRPPDSERLYIFSGDPRPFLSWRALLEVCLVAGPSAEGKLPALYYLYHAPQGALAVMAGVRSLPRDYLVAEEAGSAASPFSARDLLSTFCVYPQRVGSNAFVFRSFPIWLPEQLSAERLEEAVFQFFRENFSDTRPALLWDHPNFHRVAELMRMGWWKRLNGKASIKNT